MTVTKSRDPEPRVRLVLRSRGRKKVAWAEGTLDNENAGKKSSKKCCIYEKPRAFGESSSSSSSESDDEHDECHHDHDHDHGNE